MAGAAACGSESEPVSDEKVFGETTTAKQSTQDVVKGRFDAGGHKLYLECRGAGAPTVVYLHGSVREEGDSGHERAGRVPALLDNRNRVCVYDRANVGTSDPVAGRSRASRALRTCMRCSPRLASAVPS